MRIFTGIWIDAESSNLAAYRVDFIESDGTARLSIEFLNGNVYEYHKVPLVHVMGLAQASSKGQYFIRNIRGSYHFRQIVDFRQISPPKLTEPAPVKEKG